MFGLQTRVYPYPLGAGSARPNPKKMGAPDPENPLFLGFSVRRGGLRPWSQTMVSEGARPWGRGRSGDCEFGLLISSRSNTPLSAWQSFNRDGAGVHNNFLRSPDLPLTYGLAPSETMVSIPLWAQKTLEIKGFLGLGHPFLDLVSQTPRPRGRGRPLFAEFCP